MRSVIGSRDRKPPAPTRRVGHDRRRASLLGFIGLLAILTTAGGCIGFGPRASDGAVAAGPIGPVVKPTNGSGPAIECRGLAQDRCLRAGSVEGWVGEIDVADVDRVIVSCEGSPCTPAGGAMRIDLLLRSGAIVEIARGGYGEFRQP